MGEKKPIRKGYREERDRDSISLNVASWDGGGHQQINIVVKGWGSRGILEGEATSEERRGNIF